MAKVRSVSAPRSSNRTCVFHASGSPTGFISRHSSALRLGRKIQLTRRIPGPLRGCQAKRPMSPDRLSLGEHARSQAPFLHGHYPASPVLWACPTPDRSAVFHGVCSARSDRPGLSRCAENLPHVLLPLPRRPKKALRFHALSATAFACSLEARRPQLRFRGLLGIHSCYSPCVCSPDLIGV